MKNETKPENECFLKMRRDLKKEVWLNKKGAWLKKRGVA